MLDIQFCDRLEHELSRAFSASADANIKHFWCDGILLPLSEQEYSTKWVNDKREIIMTAFLGTDGQDKYKLTLKFGNKALSRYARGLEVLSCIPSKEDSAWFDINIVNREIFIQLN